MINKINNNVYYFTIGIITGIIICMIILCYYPIVETEQACLNCGHSAWYFKIIN